MIWILILIFLWLSALAFFAYQNINMKSDNNSNIKKDIYISKTSSKIQEFVRSWLKNINITKPEFQKIKAEIDKNIFGMDGVINAMIIWIISKNHILLSGYPWLAKTTIIKKFSESLWLKSGRIQWTVDIQPNDIIGSNIYNPVTNELQTKIWPINNNIVLVDEINRMTPKSQSALLQAMAESFITIDDKNIYLPKPFMVLATMNPHDDYGTFPMSAANLDRFALWIYIDYPNFETEKQIINNFDSENIYKSDNLTDLDFDKIYQEIQNIQISETCQNLILKIISNTRKDTKTSIWPRWTIYISQTAKAIARLEWSEVLEKHIYMSLSAVLSHRIQAENKLETVYLFL